MSSLASKRLEYRPEVSPLLKKGVLQPCKTKAPLESLRSIFPKTFAQTALELTGSSGTPKRLKRVGVVFSGGPASGGHNVIAALSDQTDELIGFLDGCAGLIEDRWRKLDEKTVASYRNQGGFDLIGTGRTKIETPQQLKAVKETCERHQLEGLVIIGGDDSNTNAAVLAEYLLAEGSKVCVIGVPKTIDGDLQSEDIEMSFGFDTATKTYAEIIGNIEKDAASMRKYYHFIKLMGRSASHVTLECALLTQPNLAVIGEEGRGLSEIVTQIAQLVQKRAAAGKQYGVILLPEGLAEFMHLEGQRDSHGNLQVSQIPIEEMLIAKVKEKLKLEKWACQGHFLGYEGRSCLPTNFDATYAYNLGLLAAVALQAKLTGYICSIQNLAKPVDLWQFKMVPIVGMMHFEERKGKQTAVIQKTLVDLKGAPFAHFTSHRLNWETEDAYVSPGPIQFFGNRDLTDEAPLSLRLRGR